MITATNISTTNQTDVFIAGDESAVTTLIICNHDAVTDATVNVWVVPGTGTPRLPGTTAVQHQILKDLRIVASDTFVMDMEKLVLDLQDKIVVQASIGNAVNVVISSMAIE